MAGYGLLPQFDCVFCPLLRPVFVGLQSFWVARIEEPSRQPSGCLPPTTSSAISVASRNNDDLAEVSLSLGDTIPDFDLKLEKAADLRALPSRLSEDSPADTKIIIVPSESSSPKGRRSSFASSASRLSDAYTDFSSVDVCAGRSDDFLGKVRS